MSLHSLPAIRRLSEHATDANQVAQMLDSASHIRQDAIGPEARLDAAYRAILQ